MTDKINVFVFEKSLTLRFSLRGNCSFAAGKAHSVVTAGAISVADTFTDISAAVSGQSLPLFVSISVSFLPPLPPLQQL